LAVRCAGTKRDNSPCTATVEPPQEYCWWHDPANAEKRRRAASKAGKSKPSRELVELKAQLQDLTQDVLAGRLETGRAAVANQLINTRLRAIELERKIRETDELEARIEVLEQPQEAGRQWGA
jgi:LPS O-antigen subunit length determinant protein (WzzB/FepE family)